MSDEFEHAQEQLEHAAHGHKGAAHTRPAIVIAVMAAALALTEFAAKDAQVNFLTDHIAASDTWAQYQAKAVRQTKLWGYLTAYDHDFSRLSPGSMLIPTLVDYAFSRGYTEYDFLSGEESYKMQWTKGFHHTYRLLVWNRRPMSRLRASVYLRLRVGSTVSDMVEHPAE